jgi:micrococcal nuclease
MPRSVLFVLAVAAVIVAFLLACVPATAAIAAPRVRVVDGDGLRFCHIRACRAVRLCGIDAPELDTAAGQAARRALQHHIAGRPVRCVPVGEGTPCDGRSRPTHGRRTVARCFAGSDDLAALQVAAGHACDWPRYSGGHYGHLGATCRR